MDNPFYFGKTVSGTSFLNRERELLELTETLGRGQNIILFSPRRYGKTSLIKRVITRLQEKKIQVFYFDFYRIASLEEFYRYYSTTVINSLQSPFEKAFSLARSLIPSLKPRLVYSEPTQPSIEVEVSMDVLTKKSSLNELFDSIEKYCGMKKKKACVVFDEFQEIATIENGELLEREMRSAMQHHKLVSYAFLGSKYHMMNTLFTDKSRPFYNFGSRYDLPVIAPEEWMPFIGKLFKKGDYTFPETACARMLLFTQGHPYYTQLFASDLWERFRDTKNINERDVVSTLPLILQRESHAFAEMWDSLSSPERKLISAIAGSSDDTIFSHTFMSRNNLGALSSLQRTVLALTKRGLLRKMGRSYVVTDPLFLLWIKQGD